MEEAKKARTLAKSGFTRAEKSLSDALKLENLPLSTLDRRFNDLKLKWDICQETHDNYALFSEEIEATEAEGLDGWIDDLSERFSVIEIKADGKRDTHVSKQQASTATAGATPPGLGFSGIVKVEKVKFPSFYGDLRHYPLFKKDFLNQIAPQYKDTQVAFVLKGYLSSEIRASIENCGDDSKKIWERLDMRYGNVQKLVDLILNDIKKLPAGKSDDISTISMIETIETAYQDLVRMNCEMEMSNSTIISEIEKRMPPKMKDEWASLITKGASTTPNAYLSAISTTQRFAALLELLGDWRRKLEYLNASLRAEPSSFQGEAHHLRDAPQIRNRGLDKCWYHDLEGGPNYHPIFKCRAFRSLPVESRIKMMKENKICLVCQEKSCPGGSGDKCQDPRFKCRESGCEGNHHHTLHFTGNEQAASHASMSGNGQTLLLTQNL